MSAPSNGHIAWALGGSVEWYEREGEVYRAPRTNALDTDGYRHGRWECSRAHFERYRAMLVGP